MDQLANRDREVRLIITDKPQWEEKAIFHIFYPENKATGQTIEVRQTTTTATVWQEAQQVISSIDKKTKLKSIHVVISPNGNMEEFTKGNVGPNQLGELAKQHRKIILQTQRSPQLEKKTGNCACTYILQGMAQSMW